MIVAADNDAEHDATIIKLMIRARENNSKFNRTKIKFKKPELVFVGNIVSNDGLKPEEEKVRAIRYLPEPQSKPELQRIMGMLNYLAQSIPNMSTVSAPL